MAWCIEQKMINSETNDQEECNYRISLFANLIQRALSWILNPLAASSRIYVET